MLLNELSNSSNLKSFSINGLFGYKDVKIPFDKQAAIFIAENGSGKTTILNALYYSIACKFHKLRTIEFDSIILKFNSGDSVTICRSDLDDFKQNGRLETVISSVKSYLSPSGVSRFESILLYAEMEDAPQSLVFTELINLLQDYNVPAKYFKFLEESIIISKKSNQPKQKNISKRVIQIIQDNLNKSILYFPTYRRIEEDLNSLGYKEERLEDLNFGDRDGKLIQFGMNDVINKFKEIKDDITNSSLSIFSKLTGEMLTQFVGGTKITEDMLNSIKPETLNIVFSRVGEKNISTADKESIEQLVNSGAIRDPQHTQLVHFLSKLVYLYEQQKEKDDSIKQFATICNKYLNKKRIVYDETTVDISVIQTRDNSPIDIKSLSSGEKQIISLFSKIYLESTEEFILLFDEPELSLSIEWQRLLLPDIMNSGKCQLLLAVTHSPFIFDNELDLNANDLDMFVSEK
jgi:predicted ATPase